MKFSPVLIALCIAVSFFGSTEASSSSSGLTNSLHDEQKTETSYLSELRKLESDEDEDEDEESSEEEESAADDEDEDEPEEEDADEMEMAYVAYGAIGGAAVILSTVGFLEHRRKVRVSREYDESNYHLNTDNAPGSGSMV